MHCRIPARQQKRENYNTLKHERIGSIKIWV